MDRFRFRAFSPILAQKFGEKYLKIRKNLEKQLDLVNYFSDKDWIIMQCTGLKDKNGKLIYEGDILKDPNWIKQSEYAPKEPLYKIEYHNPSHRLMLYVTGMDEYDEIDQILNQLDKCPLEIIGNIYENPQLLEVEDAK